ncbi:PP2C family protein-serine/threonine phosphatase [Georgenia faecalis]|uniref:PP2C family protein-serine/threonine phosphatase n=1 Tax=Georgenia faecalis TaxID=2483799 RepID=A0ABV9DAC4_9MICO|nr:protein phosphatase 2C domain-containing protein [Georgenia faecalis]
MRTQWGVATDTGGHRRVNEDAVLARPPVFVVADGMGGHARGDMASRTVVAELAALASGDAPLRPDDVRAAVGRAASRIRETMAADAEPAAAGSTLAGVVLTEQDGEPYWLVLNVGDSRVYRSAATGLEQVSVDHSLVQELVDAGTIDAEQARRHPQRNVITRAVGTGAVPDVDFWMLRALAGERLLVCSDGLVEELSDAEIGEVLGGAGDAPAVAEALVARAMGDAGARDNVTALVVEVVPGDD